MHALPVIDTHAHLDACGEPVDLMLSRARAAGVERIVAVGSGIESCRQTLALAERERGVFAALGIHPHQAGGEEGERLAELRELARADAAVAIGETGLDFYRDYAPRARQLDLFERQLELADELGKPVVVHTRNAPDETAATLRGFTGAVVLHCFSCVELLSVALERHYHVSFAGNVTYPRSADLRAAVAAVPSDRLLVETDSPYLAPQPVRGRPNEPAHLVHTLAALAQIRGDDAEELAAQIDRNAAEAFALP